MSAADTGAPTPTGHASTAASPAVQHRAPRIWVWFLIGFGCWPLVRFSWALSSVVQWRLPETNSGSSRMGGSGSWSSAVLSWS